MSTTAPGWRGSLPALAPVGAGLLAILLHVGALGHGFTFDDPHIVVENPVVTGDGGLWSVFASHYWAGTDASGPLYRPLTVATYWLQHRLAGTAPWSWHMVNLLLHGAVTAMFCLLAARLVSRQAALAAALLFAAHPVHVEAVVNVAGRAELLAAAGVVGAWLWRDRPWAASCLLAGGLLSKESAVVLPALLLAEDLLAGGRVRVRRLAAPAAVVCGYLALRLMVVGPGLSTPVDPFFGVPAAHRVMTAVEVLGREVLLMLAPVTLSADYSYNQIPVVTSPLNGGFLPGVAIVAACAGLAGACRRRVAGVTLGVAVFFIALLPVSNLLFGIGVMLAERLLYLPSVGACLAGGAALAAMAAATRSRDRVAATLAAALIVTVPLAARTTWRVGDWFDQVSLFESTVRTSPRSALARVNLGTVYQRLGRLAEAEEQFRAAVAIAPARPGVHFNLGACLEAQGRIPEALAAYVEAARLAPDDPRTASSLRRARQALAGTAGAGELRAQRPSP